MSSSHKQKRRQLESMPAHFRDYFLAVDRGYGEARLLLLQMAHRLKLRGFDWSWGREQNNNYQDHAFNPLTIRAGGREQKIRIELELLAAMGDCRRREQDGPHGWFFDQVEPVMVRLGEG